jgi:hypothetical protein
VHDSLVDLIDLADVEERWFVDEEVAWRHVCSGAAMLNPTLVRPCSVRHASAYAGVATPSLRPQTLSVEELREMTRTPHNALSLVYKSLDGWDVFHDMHTHKRHARNGKKSNQPSVSMASLLGIEEDVSTLSGVKGADELNDNALAYPGQRINSYFVRRGRGVASRRRLQVGVPFDLQMRAKISIFPKSVHFARGSYFDEYCLRGRGFLQSKALRMAADMRGGPIFWCPRRGAFGYSLRFESGVYSVTSRRRPGALEDDELDCTALHAGEKSRKELWAEGAASQLLRGARRRILGGRIATHHLPEVRCSTQPCMYLFFFLFSSFFLLFPFSFLFFLSILWICVSAST